MAKGCLALLFGIKDVPTRNTTAEYPTSEMSEGDIHSGPGGYEGMGYSGGYAADYRAEHEHQGGDEYHEH